MIKNKERTKKINKCYVQSWKYKEIINLKKNYFQDFSIAMVTTFKSQFKCSFYFIFNVNNQSVNYHFKT